jgi:plasmid stabilization system protein ParE
VWIDFHPAATEEFEKSAQWYAERSLLAGQGLALAVDDALVKIAANPDRFVQIDSVHRACSVVGFPFQIVYRRSGDCISIVAVAHAKRRPRYWKNRS